MSLNILAMNWWLLAAAVTTAFCAAGHAFAGRDMYYRPIMSALKDERLSGVLTGFWHLITIHFALSAIVLGALGTGYFRSAVAAWFIAAQFASYAVVYLVISLRLGGALKLFQWLLFGAIAILSALGALAGP